MNISSAILDMYKISDMTLADYKDFIESPAGKTKKYRIKLQTNKNGILMQNLKNAKPFMLECIKEYYSPTEYVLTGIAGCKDCIERMGIDTDTVDCLNCHRICFDKYNRRQLHRITNNNKQQINWR